MNALEKSEKSPWSDLLILMGITLLFTIGLQFIVLVLGALLTGDLNILSSIGSGEGQKEGIYFNYCLLASSSVGTFLVPAYYFQRLNRQVKIFPSQNVSDWKLYVLAILFLYVFGPLMSLISDWNMHMKLPDFLEGVEGWMRTQEDLMARLTERIVMVKEWHKLLLNILIIGFLPAISEELFFRGAMQRIFHRVFKNEYLAIWVVGVIFSAIHFQFYGFFPRLILGVVFGYLVVLTRNIWIAVFAHFVNNTTVVVLAFYYASTGKDYAALMKSDSYGLFAYLGSFVFSIIIAFIFYRYNRRKLYGKRLG
ncbi:CPBP family intramembrane glutamic endopeptidase [Sphingobacterium sp. LRF_L2]|uniref:CPBP family intramembrane glutamic endopeptidase n=1 Tax=Sphingobacterium sp. LRF_L2 TaxID=3369421 RepID=UPI003F5D869D